jgi:hypothetical protein
VFGSENTNLAAVSKIFDGYPNDCVTIGQTFFNFSVHIPQQSNSSTPLIMKKHILALLATLPFSALLIASPLSDSVEQHKLEWMLGTWTREGVSISYQWKLDKHAIGVNFTMGERKGEGMIVMPPGDDTPKYLAVDNEGGVSEGKWGETNGNPTLTVSHTTADGTVSRMSVEHAKADDQTIKVTIRKLNEAGEAEGDPMEVELKREATKKADTK